MKVITLLAAAVTQAAGADVAIDTAGPRARSEVCQVSIAGGTATVKLQGRLNANFAWVDIATFTVDGDAKEVVVMPLMRGNVTVISGATVNLSITG